jgi:protease IV
MFTKRWHVLIAAIALGAVLSMPASSPAQLNLRPAQLTTGVSDGRIAVFRMHGPLTEAPPAFDFGLDMEPRRSLHELLERFGKAKRDPNIKAVVLTFEKPVLGLGQLQEIRSALKELRAADKDVYCYLEEAGMGIYALASVASKVVMVPSGELRLMGVHLEQAYFKGLLDKIGLEADIEHVGAYKGAGEPFTQTGPSPEAQEMIEWLIGDIYEQFVETIAEGRQRTPDEVRSLIDNGPYTAKKALEAKLIDEIAYAGDFAESLRDRYGLGVEFVHNYGAKKGPELDFSSIFTLVRSLGEMMSKARVSARPAVAVVYVDGMIVTGRTEEGLFGSSGTVGSTTLRQELTKAREDDTIRAVVLRVDSPGGSALASDIIWHASNELRDKKPLIVSMGNVAASGGYYVSVGSSTIFADPGTLTGSIGVVGGKLITKGLWDWLGVSFHETKFGRNADLYNTNRPFDDREREIVRKYMQEVYDDFTDRVVQGRNDRLKKDIDELAGGRVYTGRQALANGLVDRLGGLQDAIRFAAGEANISDYDTRLLPEPKNFMDLLLESMTGKRDEDGHEIRYSLGWTLKTPAIAELLPVLERLDPLRARTVLRSLLRIELLSRETALLILPAEITLR